MADTGEITWHRRPYRDGDLTDAWYALIATSDADANRAASAEAEQHRVWCVRSDDADAATAWTPATGHSEGVTVAVLTTDARGRDPRHTAAIRDAVVEGLRDGTLVAPHHRTRTPGVALVGGGPGDPDLITVRGRRLLAEADVVIADRLGPRDLLAELPPHVEVIDAAKIPYGRFMAQEAINNALIEHAKQGKSVVRLKGGDPYVFGRGMEELQALAEAGIPCTVVPGISSSISVPGAAGIPVTHRGVAHEFTVVSGHVAPRRRTVPRRLAVAGQAHRHPGDPHGRRQDREDRRDARRPRQEPRHPRRPRPGRHDGRTAPRRRHPRDRRRDRTRRGRQTARRHRHRRRRRRGPPARRVTAAPPPRQGS
ncbi:hypothetical protein GCM10020256_64270 [Streptomyces thermocoprophilus]